MVGGEARKQYSPIAASEMVAEHILEGEVAYAVVKEEWCVNHRTSEDDEVEWSAGWIVVLSIVGPEPIRIRTRRYLVQPT
jgi:hypothetical protein